MKLYIAQSQSASVKLIMIFFEEASWVKPDFFSTFAFKLNINNTVHSLRLRFRMPDKQQKRQ